MSSTFGALLRRYRVAAGLSQEELAERAGLSAHGISDLERGARRRPYPATIRRFVHALELTEADANALRASARPPHASHPAGYTRSIASAGVLPVSLSSFIGRDQEVAEVRRQLEHSRLITLVGIGGIGKTRLALRVAADLTDAYPDGAWMVELASPADEALVAQTAVAAFGGKELPGQPALGTLVNVLRTRTLLLVLDNCEHLVGACAELAETVLVRCPGVRILATSRERLGISGETVWRVPSLAGTEMGTNTAPEHVRRSEAVQLFVERAVAVQPMFVLTEHSVPAVLEICRRLDGIPLALELAAARLAVLPVEGVAARLDNQFRLLVGGSRTAPARQRTLRATLDWSYDLLPNSERRLFERLSVFVDGCTLEAVEAVCDDDERSIGDVLDCLEGLVANSLVLAEPTSEGGLRYRLLETVRQYGIERLAESRAEDMVRHRHASYFLALAEQAELELWGPDQVAWRERLEDELDNLRAALRWLIDKRKAVEALRVAGALGAFWPIGGHLGEGRAWLAEALGLESGRGPTAARARALAAAGTLATFQSDHSAAHSVLQEGLAVSRAIGDHGLRAAVLLRLGQTEWFRGELALAVALAEEGVEAGHMAARPDLEAYNLMNLAVVSTDLGNLGVAATAAEGSLALFRRAAAPRGLALGLVAVGRVRHQRGQLSAARAALEEACAHFRTSAHPSALAWALEFLAWVATDQGDQAGLRMVVDEALALHEQLGAWDRILWCLEACACAAAAQNRYDLTLRLAATAAVARKTYSVPLYRAEQPRLERCLAGARRALGAAAAAAAWEAGQSMALEQACARVWDYPASHAGPRPIDGRSSRIVGGLTQREAEVLRMVAAGRSNHEIAEGLVLSVRTVERHISSIYEKLGASGRVSRAVATAYALTHDLAGPEGTT